MRRSFRVSLSVAIAIVALAGVRSARADIVFDPGNHPQPGEENVLFQSTQTGNTVTGFTNQTNTEVDFTSSQTLFVSASGQAKVEAVDASGNQVPVTSLTITAPNSSSWTDFIMNPEITGGIGTAGASGHVSVVASNGTFTFDYPGGLGNGNNFLTIIAVNGETITSVSITSDTGFTDLKQPRISFATAIPEPSSLVLAGTGLAVVLGVGYRRRRLRRPA
jgi:hypothetical protein